MLTRSPIPGLFVTGTDTAVGKTLVAAAIADWFKRRGLRVAVCKPIATGCEKRREGLVSEDAEFLAHHADAKFPLNTICPQRYAEPLAPAIAAERARQPIEWNAIDEAIQSMCRQSDVLIVEGVGGVMVPIARKIMVVDMMCWLDLPAIIVARPGLGTINHTLLTLQAVRSRKVSVAGVVINRYPTETPPIAEETNPRAIEKWGGTQVLCMVPEFKGSAIPNLPPDVAGAVDPVDWLAGAAAGMNTMVLNKTIVADSLDALWLFWAAYWTINAFGNKRNLYRQTIHSRWTYMAGAAAVIYAFYSFTRPLKPIFHETIWTQLGGIALCASGIGLTIWARHVLGSNWSGIITLKEDHELVRHGPYRFVRHPIYSGLIVAIAGTILAVYPFFRGAGLFVIAAILLKMKSLGEEKVLIPRFSESYHEYKREVKSLIPFVW